MNELDVGASNLNRLDQFIVALICALLLFCPLALGAVQRWSEEVFVVAAAVLALLTLLRLAQDGAGIRFGVWVAVPLIGFPLLVALQLLPLPALAGAISPAALSVRSELLDGIIPPEQALRGARMTLYAEESLRHLRLLLAVIAVFTSARVVARSRRATRWLLAGMCAAGSLVALIALSHQVLGLAKIYNMISTPRDITRTAPFINHSHFAQFMNLSIGAALALLFKEIWTIRQEHAPRTWADWVDLLRQGAFGRFVLPLLTVAVCAVGVATGGSRGGVLSLAVAGLFTTLVAGRRRRARELAFGAVLLLVVGLVAMLALSDTLKERVASNHGGERLTLLRGQTEVWRRFPIAGTGLGTFQWVFPRYDKTKPINVASHAENEYAQMMTETGAIGLALIIVFLIALWRGYAIAVRTGARRGAVALGLGFGLAAICIHSLVDFGQHLPANAAMTAVAAACLLAAAAPRRVQAETAEGSRRPSQLIVALVLLIALAGMIWPADLARRAAEASAASLAIADRLSRAGWTGSDKAFATMVHMAEQGARLRPGDAQLAYEHATARYWSIARGGRIAADVDRSALDSILRQYQQAMQLCPTYGAPYSMAGQISVWLGDTTRGELLLKRAMELSPQDGTTALFNAELALRRGDEATALELFRRAAATAAIPAEFVVQRLIGDYKRADLALKYAQGNRWALQAARDALQKQGRVGEARAVDDAIVAMVRSAADDPTAAAAVLHETAITLKSRNDPAAALPYLRRAVVRNPTELSWRFELARLLTELGDLSGAIAELTTVTRDRPDWPGAAELRNEITRRSATRPAEQQRRP